MLTGPPIALMPDTEHQMPRYIKSPPRYPHSRYTFRYNIMENDTILLIFFYLFSESQVWKQGHYAIFSALRGQKIKHSWFLIFFWSFSRQDLYMIHIKYMI